METLALQKEAKKSIGLGIRFRYQTVLPMAGVLIALFTDLLIPNHPDLRYPDLPHYRNFLYIALAVTCILAVAALFVEKVREKYYHRGYFITGVFVFLTVLQLVTAKWLLLPQLYFPSTARIFNVFFEDRQLILTCIQSSLLLLVKGILIGFVVGMVCGIAVGWSKGANYWIYPLIRILGPIPSSTWTPLALVVFPSAQGAAVFLIAFGVWFQITILTCSGIQSVKKAYFEVSSTLGANNMQNLFKIAVPAAAPSIFLGFFNATCSSFVALMAAEMIGCKSGLGWYVNWQKTMLSYPNVYAGLIVVAVFCYILVTLQFKVRDRLLSWQEGVVKW